ncbi:hypothetical protein PTNB85_02878 [Pyrenophora teres f. teres]|nr:hypothetical protein HRS9139_03030 [Pyrenophora teres f. teres]KAE8844613.1 hypothetical protein PTNB85_02878 [Pyrenophora teres f. teres]KAE8866240.1 hypothetical protein PTNB29_03387 [Pyrenophora teres f. teres]
MTARSVDQPVEGKELRTHAVADTRVERDLQQWPSTRDEEIVEATYGPHGASETADHQTEKPPGPALARILSRRSAASYDPGPAPDGGLTAWTQVLCTHLTIFTTFGLFTSFGVYQTYYENTLGIAPSTISWIGSIQVFLLFFLGTFTGRATDAGLFRPVYIAGACFQLVGIFTLAESKSVWQLFLSQGVCLGLANGLQFCPSMALVSTYFVKRRAFALGFTALGSCTGGVVFPVIVQQCLPSLGFPWTIRIIGFIMLLLNAVTISLYRTRLPPRKAGPLVDWASFSELPYTLYCAGAFFSFWGLYFAFFYIGSYARNVLGATYQQSINLLLVQVCMGFIFRLLPTYYADKIGGLNVLIPFAFICAIMMFAWIGIKSMGTLYVFAVIYGSGSAVIQALWPAVIGGMSRERDLKKAGVRMGMAFTVVSISSFTGPPLAGALIQMNHGSYTYANIWAGMSFFFGGCLLIATRVALVGWNLRDTVTPALTTSFPPNAYLGCNQAEANANGTGDRLFDPSTGATFRHSVSVPVTQQTCRTYCSTTAPGAPYLYFGIEFGINCRCGADFFIPKIQVDDSQCNISAAGDVSQAGGGANRMSVWQYVPYPGTSQDTTPSCSRSIDTLPSLDTSTLPQQHAYQLALTQPALTNTISHDIQDTHSHPAITTIFVAITPPFLYLPTSSSLLPIPIPPLYSLYMLIAHIPILFTTSISHI